MDRRSGSLANATSNTSQSDNSPTFDKAPTDAVSRMRSIMRSMRAERVLAQGDAGNAPLAPSPQAQVDTAEGGKRHSTQENNTARSVDGADDAIGSMAEMRKNAETTKPVKATFCAATNVKDTFSFGTKSQVSRTDRDTVPSKATFCAQDEPTSYTQPTATIRRQISPPVAHEVATALQTQTSSSLKREDNRALEMRIQQARKRRKIDLSHSPQSPATQPAGRRKIDYENDLRRKVLVDQWQTSQHLPSSHAALTKSISTTYPTTPVNPAAAARASNQTAKPALSPTMDVERHITPAGSATTNVHPTLTRGPVNIHDSVGQQNPTTAFTRASAPTNTNIQRLHHPSAITKDAPPPRMPPGPAKKSNQAHYGSMDWLVVHTPPQTIPQAYQSQHPQKPALKATLPPRLSPGVGEFALPAQPHTASSKTSTQINKKKASPAIDNNLPLAHHAGRPAGSRTTSATVNGTKSIPPRRAPTVPAPLTGASSGSAFFMDYQYNLNQPDHLLVNDEMSDDDFKALLDTHCPGAPGTVWISSAATRTGVDIGREDDQPIHQGVGLGKTIPKRWRREGTEDVNA